MAKYGKKNVMKLGLENYDIGILGEGGIGKTTLAKEVCEKIAGENGYMILNIGTENSVSAIQGIEYEDAPDWESFADICDDIIDNKKEDYPDLKMLVIDTIDQLFVLGEKEVIRRCNIEGRNRKDFVKCTSINQAYGGYGKGMDKTVELIINEISDLQKAGICLFFVGHTKRKELEDSTTGTTYAKLTADMPAKYFTVIRNLLNVLGVIYIDREIVKAEKEQKSSSTKKKNKVVSESRKIKFRDDSYVMDTKSHFSDIVDEIPLDADEFIRVINEAIKVEAAKGTLPVKSAVKTSNADKSEDEIQHDDTTIDLKDYDSPVGVLPTDSEDSIYPEVEEDKIDGMKAEVKNKFREASKETKKLIKELLDGEKLSEINDEGKLKEILKTLEAAE